MFGRFLLIAVLLTYTEALTAQIKYLHEVPFFPSASESQQGFVRIVNHSGEAANLSIRAIDEVGNARPNVTLEVPPKQARHFNSDDLEWGNEAKGLVGSVGAGVGTWRLAIVSDVDSIEVFSFLRTTDGFMTGMGRTAQFYTMLGQPDVKTFDVPIVNPASNHFQLSILRITNHHQERVRFQLVGTDDAGREARCDVEIDAGATESFRAYELEDGGVCIGDTEGFGDGKGKWFVTGTVERDKRITVVNILDSGSHVSNLSHPRVASRAFNEEDESVLLPVGDGYCRPGDIVRLGQICRIYNTFIDFDVQSNGQGCLADLICSDRRHESRDTTIDGDLITFVASRNDDDSWTIEEVEPKPL